MTQQLLLHRSSSFVLSQYVKRTTCSVVQQQTRYLSSSSSSSSSPPSQQQQSTTSTSTTTLGGPTTSTAPGTGTTNNSIAVTGGGSKQRTAWRNLSSLPMEYTDHDEPYHHSSNDINEPSLPSLPSPSHLSYVADISYPITSKLNIVTPADDTPSGIWPVYRIMDESGNFRHSNSDGYGNKVPFHESYNLGSPSSGISSNNDDDHDHVHQNIHELKNKLLHQYPEHINALQSSPIFQTITHSITTNANSNSNSNNSAIRSFANTFSSLNDHNNSRTKDKNSILLRSHRYMTRLRQMDDILLNAQRQGRVSFYLTCRGEEGIHIGSASALSMEDVVLAQYREQGVFMWRGFTLNQFTNQCMTNDLDLGRGRQMPIHYGSRALNIHTISSPLGTQLPHAVGVAYKKKLEKLEQDKKNNSISIVYFGDGAASTTDFHSALNFASTLKVPMIFFCRNNGYAISTKTTEQYASDGIVSRCKGYGMAGIRVDGNDIFAVHAATKAARDYAIEHSEPVLIEAISYRQGHHSTSDDSSQYRSNEEVAECECEYDPLNRLEKFLLQQNWIDEERIASIQKEERKSVLDALQQAEKRNKPSVDTMFQDVYSQMPLNLVMQEKSLHKHMEKYPSKYDH